MTEYTSNGKPVTAERIERALDSLAEIIVNAGRKGTAYLPIYKRLKDELGKLKDEELLMEEIRERAQKLKQSRKRRSRRTPQ